MDKVSTPTFIRLFVSTCVMIQEYSHWYTTAADLLLCTSADFFRFVRPQYMQCCLHSRHVLATWALSIVRWDLSLSDYVCQTMGNHDAVQRAVLVIETDPNQGRHKDTTHVVFKALTKPFPGDWASLTFLVGPNGNAGSSDMPFRASSQPWSSANRGPKALGHLLRLLLLPAR